MYCGGGAERKLVLWVHRHCRRLVAFQVITLESSPAGGNPNSGTDHLGVAASEAFPFLPHKIAVFSQTADSAKH